MSVDINGAIAEWLTNVLREIGDPDGLREHAEELQKQADHVRAVHAQLAAEVGSSSWSGADYDSFSSAWHEHAKLAEDTANSLQATANQVDDHADRTWEIVKEVIGIALEILEILAIGLLLSWLMAGIANLIWARIAPLIERIVELLARFRAMLGDFAEWAKEVGSTAGKVGEKIGTMIGRGAEKFITELPDYTLAYAKFYLAEAITPALSGRDVAWADNAWQTALFFGMDIGNNLIESGLESIFGKAFRGAVDEASVTGRSARAEGAEGSVSVDGAAARTEGGASPDPVDVDRDVRGDAGSETSSVAESDHAAARSVRGDAGSADTHGASGDRTAGGDLEAGLRDVRLESEPVVGEQGVPAWAEAEGSAGSTSRLADSAAVRKTAAPSLREAPGSGENRVRSASRSSRPQEFSMSSDGDSVRSVRMVRPGDEPLPYRGGPEIARPVGPGGASKVSLPEGSAVKTAPSEPPLGAAAHDADAPTADAARSARPEHASDGPIPQRPQGETPHAAEPHPGDPAHEAVPEADPARVARPEGTSETPRPGTPVAEAPPPEAPLGAPAREAIAETGPARALRPEGTARETPVPEPRVKVDPAAEVRPGAASHDADALTADAARGARPEHAPEGPLPERPQVETPHSAETRPGSPVHDTVPETGPAPAVRPETAPAPAVRAEAPHAEAPVREGLPGAHSPDPASPSLPRTTESPAAVHGTPVDGTSFPDVEADALRMGDILSPRSSIRTDEFRVPDSSKLPDTHKPFEPKTLADSVLAGAKEGFNILIGNLQTNAVINYIHHADQHVSGEQFGLQVLGGFLGGFRQSLYHSLPVGERFGYRSEQPGQASIMHWLFSSQPVSWAYYSMYLTAKEAIINGASGQTTPTELTRPNGQ
ncbi:WXG100 family type VII secretion target [Streptomyces sp. NPDC048279]|uniref:WXG100 family type VII secretion target n=1 Tax=Streptomyces sp. NPDC048279 TaxID=3154714 RepID=UPI00342DB13F